MIVDIVFDGPPGHEPGRFVEVEDKTGKSINIGEWIDRGNGFWALRISATGCCERDHDGDGRCDRHTPQAAQMMRETLARQPAQLATETERIREAFVAGYLRAHLHPRSGGFDPRGVALQEFALEPPILPGDQQPTTANEIDKTVTAGKFVDALTANADMQKIVERVERSMRDMPGPVRDEWSTTDRVGRVLEHAHQIYPRSPDYKGFVLDDKGIECLLYAIFDEIWLEYARRTRQSRRSRSHDR